MTSIFDPRHSEVVRSICEISYNDVSDYITPTGKRIEFKETSPRIRKFKKQNYLIDVVMWTLKAKDYKSHDFFIFVNHDCEQPTFYICEAKDIDTFLSKKKKFSESTGIYISTIEKLKLLKTDNKHIIKTFLED